MGIIGWLFGKRDPKTDFARHIPALAEATRNIELGIYWRLTKQYEKENKGVDLYKLAYAVVYDLMQDESGKRSLGDFAEKHADLIAHEVRQAAKDEEIRNALSLEYAGRLMAVSWGSGKSLSEAYWEKANVMIEKAKTLGFEITNIVSLWGSKAIVNLHAFAVKFRQESV